MTDLMRYAADLEGLAHGALPPVEQWRPARIGAIDIVIRRDGTWLHEGAPIERARLVRLFSTILRREADGYYLVTPAEKLKITVEDAPFLAVLMTAEATGEAQRLTFTTNVGDRVLAGAEHPITASGDAPYLHIRSSLTARIGRSVYYDLVELGQTRHIDGAEQFGVWSNRVFFPLAAAPDF